MVKKSYWNSNFGPSEGIQIQNFPRTVSLDSIGDSTSLKVIIQAEFTEVFLILKILIMKILKGEMSKREDQIKRWNQLWHEILLIHLFSTHKYFWNIYFIIFHRITPIEYQSKYQHTKSIIVSIRIKFYR